MILPPWVQAIEKGAVAVVSEEEVEDDEDVVVPIILAEDSEEVLRRLAISFYNDPSKKMLTVGVIGIPPPLRASEQTRV
jgi:UDP-N-acetylmuramyl tripeptide synthase